MGIARSRIRWNGWGWVDGRNGLASREDVWRWLADETGMPALLATPARALEECTLPPPRLARPLLQQFSDSLGKTQVRSDDYERAFHARGRSYHDLIRLRAGDLACAPDAVLYPRGEDEVRAVLIFAAAHNIAVIPFGGGTGMAGGVNPVAGGAAGTVTLDLSAMDRMLEIDAAAGIATAEAGIGGAALEGALGAAGLTLGYSPWDFEFSTLGGWIARGGPLADRLARVRLVTAHGVLDSGDAPVCAAGLDLGWIALGSEGTLGIITQATLKVRAASPKRERSFLFPDFSRGVAAIREGAAIPHAVLQLSDGAETRFRRTRARLEKTAGLMTRLSDAWIAAWHFNDHAALLLAGFDDEAGARGFTALAKKHGGVALAQNAVKARDDARFDTFYRRDALLDRGMGLEIVETAVSWRKLSALRAAVTQALDAAMRAHAARPGARGLAMAQVTDVYRDGASLAFTALFPRRLEDETGQWRAIRHAATQAILAHGGTLGHRQGVGEDDLPWLSREKGPLGMAVQRALKTALDPENILNPGKLIEKN